MDITRKHRDLINETKNPNVLKDLSLENGMTTLGQECRDLVLKGITTINELATITLLSDI